jgi:signal transduction histidine kinase
MLELAVASSLIVGLFGAVVMHAVRRRSLGLSIVTAALTPVLAVVAAVLINVRAMFISHHDSRVVLVTLACSAVVAVGLSVGLGRRVALGSRALSVQVRHLASAYDVDAAGSPDRAPALSGGADSAAASTPAELSALAAALAEARDRLEESRRRERALEASRRELVAFMSHDLRTPLAGLRALAEGLEDGVIDDSAAALARMRLTVERMSGLVDDLFELSRLTAETPTRRVSSVSLAELVEDVAALLDDHARAHGVRVVVEAPRDDRLRVNGDADQLSRALTNVLANAVRHTPSGGVVHLAAGRSPEGRVWSTVSDGCGGIAEADLARVFDVGWRAAADRTPQDGGAGLGLAIAQGVVQAHDGTIEVSNVGAGCVFEVSLPAGATAG